jgi:hypothetical protein
MRQTYFHVLLATGVYKTSAKYDDPFTSQQFSSQKVLNGFLFNAALAKIYTASLISVFISSI